MKTALLVLLFVVMGCANVQTGLVMGTQKAAEAADKTLNAALWYICRGASVGAIQRKYGTRPEAYKSLCSGIPMGVIGK